MYVDIIGAEKETFNYRKLYVSCTNRVRTCTLQHDPILLAVMVIAEWSKPNTLGTKTCL